MKRLSYILLISLTLCACNQHSTNSEVPEKFDSSPTLVSGDSSAGGPDSSFLQRQQEQADSSPEIKRLPHRYVPPSREPGGKGFDESHRAELDSIFSPKNMAIEQRRNDSMRVVALRKIAIEDSLRKLK